MHARFIRRLAVLCAWSALVVGLPQRSRAAWNVVIDFSTASTCRGAEGIAFHRPSGTLLAVSGNEVFQLAAYGGLLNRFAVDGHSQTRLRGIDVLPTGSLLLVSDNAHRLYEVSPSGRMIAAKSLDAEVTPGGVVYDRYRGLVTVADRSDGSLKSFLTGRPEAKGPAEALSLAFAEATGVLKPSPHVYWILDGKQAKVFRHTEDKTTELIDVAAVCGYEDADGLAFNRAKGILYVCFDESERIIGIDVSRLDDLNGRPGTGASSPAVDQASPPEPLPVPQRDVPPAAELQIPGNIVQPGHDFTKPLVINPPYPPSTIHVHPSQPATIYIVPLIIPADALQQSQPRPDLAVTGITVTCADRHRLEYRFTVTNQGKSAVSGNDIGVSAFLSFDRYLNRRDMAIGSVRLNGVLLPSGGSHSTTASWKPGHSISGRRFLILQVDAKDRVLESDETNNLASASLPH